MHFLGPNFDNGFKSLSIVFRKLCVNIKFNHQFVPPYTKSTHWELDPFPKYCIDHPETNNLLFWGAFHATSMGNKHNIVHCRC
jgi:hypothetical protein